MKRMLMISTAATLLSATLACGESSTSGQVSGTAAGETKGAVPGTEAQATAGAAASVVATADPGSRLEAIKARGEKVSEKARARVERKLENVAKKVEQTASEAEARVVGRLAAEFGAGAEVLVQERSNLDVTWGELMIAHTLMANSKTEVTVGQLVELRKEIGWGQIAAGLGLDLDEAVSAANAEAHVAMGLAKADGKVAVVHGSRAGVAVRTETRADARAGSTRIGAGANAAAGARASLPKIKIGN